jgi:hypothetical protein
MIWHVLASAIGSATQGRTEMQVDCFRSFGDVQPAFAKLAARDSITPMRSITLS